MCRFVWRGYFLFFNAGLAAFQPFLDGGAGSTGLPVKVFYLSGKRKKIVFAALWWQPCRLHICREGFAMFVVVLQAHQAKSLGLFFAGLFFGSLLRYPFLARR